MSTRGGPGARTDGGKAKRGAAQKAGGEDAPPRGGAAAERTPPTPSVSEVVGVNVNPRGDRTPRAGEPGAAIAEQGRTLRVLGPRASHSISTEKTSPGRPGRPGLQHRSPPPRTGGRLPRWAREAEVCGEV